MNDSFFVGLDLSSDMLWAVAASGVGTAEMKVLATEKSPTKAIRDGAIINPQAAIRDIRGILTGLESRVGRKIKYVYVGMCDKTIRGEVSRGMVPIGFPGRAVTSRDVERCSAIANIFNLPLDMELIHSIPLRFFIDDKLAVENPVGLIATKLSVEMYMISASHSGLANIFSCVDKAGFILKEAVYSGLAAGYAVLDDRERKDGALVIDIHKNMTHMILFSGSVLNEIFLLDRGAGRADGLLEAAKKELQKSQLASAAKKIVFIGQGALSDGLIENAEQIFSKPARIGVARNVVGDVDSSEALIHQAGFGVIKYASLKTKTKRRHDSLWSQFRRKAWEVIDSYF